MKPPFALSLSFDGIRLLHRAAGGWRVVGDVALDVPDMAGALKDLRAAATALDQGELRTKLLLPNEQIKYLTIETSDMDDAARRDAAEQALDGATPYPVADLAFDFSVEGDKTHIAAVARETLAEAEGFAVEHDFKPMCFAAIPGDQNYLGEPFFGSTAAADQFLEKGEELAPDGIAVVVIGDVEVADPPIAEPVPDETPPAPEEAPVDQSVPVEDTEAPEPETEHQSLPDPIGPSLPEPVNAETIIDPEPPVADQVPDLVAPRTDSTGPQIGFASRRPPEKSNIPSLGGADRRLHLEPATPIVAAAGVTAAEIALEPEGAAPLPDTPARSGLLTGLAEADVPQPVAIAVPKPAPADGGSERDRMTVFGARQAQIGGKPRFLGLILTTALLVFLAGVAAWASVFFDEDSRLSRLFAGRAPEVAPLDPPPVKAPKQDVQTAALDPALTPEDSAVLDALSEPQEPEPVKRPTTTDVEAKYATDGIWARAPLVPPAPAGLIDLDDLYLTSIDPVSTTTDAVALPAAATFVTDAALTRIASPAAAGTRFALNEQGLVIPTAQGALSPDGFTVYQGRPPLMPPVTPARLQTEPEDTVIRSALAAVRPKPRPGDLAETTERAQLDGLTRSELAAYRPALRPQSLQEQAEAAAAPAPVDTDAAVTEALTAPDPVASATRLATAASLRPDTRPQNFSRTVQRAEQLRPQEETRVASAAAVAPRAVTPKIPSKASVAKAATTKNAINLRNVNLIGVYGKPSNRRALVRLSNGRYKKVVVGDRVDGGVVSAIGEGELRYRKRGRDLVLKMPR